jgi:hypothetical protein
VLVSAASIGFLARTAVSFDPLQKQGHFHCMEINALRSLSNALALDIIGAVLTAPNKETKPCPHTIQR